MTELKASGGLCAPISSAFFFPPQFDDIWPNDTVGKSRFRRFFSWTKDWGLRLRGGPAPRLRDFMPVLSVQRGSIRYATPKMDG